MYVKTNMCNIYARAHVHVHVNVLWFTTLVTDYTRGVAPVGGPAPRSPVHVLSPHVSGAGMHAGRRLGDDDAADGSLGAVCRPPASHDVR